MSAADESARLAAAIYGPARPDAALVDDAPPPSLAQLPVEPSASAIRALRLGNGWTQEDMALLLPVSARSVRAWETGARRMPQAIWSLILSLHHAPVRRLMRRYGWRGRFVQRRRP